MQLDQDSKAELTRSAELPVLEILATAPNSLFDGITSAIADLCDAPVVWLTILDEDKERVLSRFGLTEKEWPCNEALWSQVLSKPTELIQLTNDRLALLPHSVPVPAGDQESGFFAVQPLVSALGYAFGLLCVYDPQRRQLTTDQIGSLVRLGGLAACLMEQKQPPATDGFYASLGESVSFAAAVTNPNLPDQPITFCNNAFCRLTGYDRAEILGQNFRFLQGEGTDPIATANLQRDLALGSVRTLVMRNYRKDGTEFWNDVNISIDRDPAGGVRQFVWTAHDVTEKIKVREQLVLTGDPFEHLPEEVYVSDAETGQFLLVNEAARQSLGYSKEEILRLKAIDINPQLTPNHFERLVLPIRQRVVDVLVHRTVFQRKDGTHYPVESKLRRSYLGRTEAIVCYAVDISERQYVEKIIREGNGRKSLADLRSEEQANSDESALFDALDVAREANRSKSDFLAAASHDLRQPLHSIGLGLDRLQNSHSLTETREVTQMIRSSVSAMGDLLSALLDIAKFDNGSMKASKEVFDLDAMLKRIVQGNSLWANEKGLLINYAQCGINVYSDQALLERIVDNFVSNAIRFTDTGRIAIKASRDTTNVRITVSDSGVGLPPESLKLIFEQYYQLDNGASNSHKGLGLGLAVVNRIARLLNHPVSVVSEVGKGSEFSVDVPIANSALETAETAVFVETKTHKSKLVHVLLVEDDRFIALTMTALLRKEGYEVFDSSTVQDALAGIESGFRPTVIVTDFRLPGGNGIDVIYQIRRKMAIDIPALIVTGDANSEHIHRMLPEMCHVLYKPVAFDVLNSTVLKMLEDTESKHAQGSYFESSGGTDQ